MKLPTLLRRTHGYSLALAALFNSQAISQIPPTASNTANQSAPIPMDQLGALAGIQYQGDGLSVSATPDGARLRCAFQRLEGQVTQEGLWLSSTADHASGERFRVVASEVGRVTPCAPAEVFGFDFINPLAPPSASLAPSVGERDGVEGLPLSGIVSVTDNVARLIRPGLTEEYSVSVDGVRQDFIIEQRPSGDGELRVTLQVTGAKAEPLVNGARLVLAGSGRNLAYNRLRVTDATGRELSARMEVASGILPDVEGAHPAARNSASNNSTANFQARRESAGLEATALWQAGMPAATKLAVLVDDANAIYPVRIDPTFSDADWSPLSGTPGKTNILYAIAVDGPGNLYIGGEHSLFATNRVAKWDGNNWSTLGSGMGGALGPYCVVYALTVSGSNLYAGGTFISADGIIVNGIAKWDGVAWSALGLGVNGSVRALAVSGTNVYAGGTFTTAGGVSANRIAKWDGNVWSPMGTGFAGYVSALAVSGSDLYVGGATFTTGYPNITKWDGSYWSELGSGVKGTVWALAIQGTDLYAGGEFSMAGGTPAKFIAKWDGSAWSALGSGMNHYVHSIAVLGTDVYAGGIFTMAGETSANRIAKWDGNMWSALGSGMNSNITALAISGTNLFAAGEFTVAGNKPSLFLAKANISAARGRFSNLHYSSPAGFSCTFLDASVGQPYRIQTSASLAAGPWTDFTNFTYTGPFVITDASAFSGTNKFFRAITP